MTLEVQRLLLQSWDWRVEPRFWILKVKPKKKKKQFYGSENHKQFTFYWNKKLSSLRKCFATAAVIFTMCRRFPLCFSYSQCIQWLLITLVQNTVLLLIVVLTLFGIFIVHLCIMYSPSLFLTEHPHFTSSNSHHQPTFTLSSLRTVLQCMI